MISVQLAVLFANPTGSPVDRSDFSDVLFNSEIP